MAQFKTIGLTARNNIEIVDSLQAVIRFLEQNSGTNILLDENIANLLDGNKHPLFSMDNLGSNFDLVIVVGGDGSLLQVASSLADHDLPVTGINRGTLGFLTDILPGDIESTLQPILDGEFKIESRFLLELSIGAGAQNYLGSALNDIVLHPGKAVQMIEFELYIDNEFVYNQASDGLIVATPTGSTAYAMSAGGPIMHPRLDAIVLVPINPHSLSSRPIVVEGNRELTLVVGDRHNILPQLSCDGAMSHSCSPGDRITIRKKQKELKILHPADYDYYETCRSKLGWSHRPTNRSFNR
ncbi:NAD(+) kinase [Gammaproteobacteria bacterium]|jgi:NAD+ kinase|nr:NAD(+) kinase [Gammaproteobacteria bacterium]